MGRVKNKVAIITEVLLVWENQALSAAREGAKI